MQTQRIAEYDGLRGLAAATVVAFHFFGYYLPWGWAALDVFFVLSGYLITKVILQYGHSWEFLPVFVARRGLRTWPIYYFLIIFLVLQGWCNPETLPYYLTYTQELPRYWNSENPTWLAMQHTWTLALEEQFYLIWPIIVLSTGRRWIGPLALSLAIASVEARIAGVHWWTLLGRCDGFALGGLLATILEDPDHARGRRRAVYWAAGIGSLAVLLAIGLGMIGRLRDAGGPFCFGLHVTLSSFFSFTLVALVAAQVGRPWVAPLRMAPFVYLGKISYGLYLYHYPIVILVMEIPLFVGVSLGPALWASQIGLAVLVAVLSWHLIERPILSLRRWIPYQESGGDALAELVTAPLVELAERSS